MKPNTDHRPHKFEQVVTLEQPSRIILVDETDNYITVSGVTHIPAVEIETVDAADLDAGDLSSVLAADTATQVHASTDSTYLIPPDVAFTTHPVDQIAPSEQAGQNRQRTSGE